MNKKSPPPKGTKAELSPAEVDALEKRLRLAAGSYYELDEPVVEKSLGQGWVQNKPPGIVKRFGNLLLPPRKHKKPAT